MDRRLSFLDPYNLKRNPIPLTGLGKGSVAVTSVNETISTGSVQASSSDKS